METGVKYAIPIPSNENLERDIAGLLTRPAGGFASGEWFPRVGFIVTNLKNK